MSGESQTMTFKADNADLLMKMDQEFEKRRKNMQDRNKELGVIRSLGSEEEKLARIRTGSLEKFNREIMASSNRIKVFNAQIYGTGGTGGMVGMDKRMMMQNASYAINDFLSQFSNAGLAAGLRGASNNIEMMVGATNPLAGILVGATVAAIGMVPALRTLGKEHEDAADKAKEHTKALDDLQKKTDQMRFGEKTVSGREDLDKIRSAITEKEKDVGKLRAAFPGIAGHQERAQRGEHGFAVDPRVQRGTPEYKALMEKQKQGILVGDPANKALAPFFETEINIENIDAEIAKQKAKLKLLEGLQGVDEKLERERLNKRMLDIEKAKEIRGLPSKFRRGKYQASRSALRRIEQKYGQREADQAIRLLELEESRDIIMKPDPEGTAPHENQGMKAIDKEAASHNLKMADPLNGRGTAAERNKIRRDALNAIGKGDPNDPASKAVDELLAKPFIGGPAPSPPPQLKRQKELSNRDYYITHKFAVEKEIAKENAKNRDIEMSRNIGQQKRIADANAEERRIMQEHQDMVNGGIKGTGPKAKAGWSNEREWQDKRAFDADVKQLIERMIFGIEEIADNTAAAAAATSGNQSSPIQTSRLSRNHGYGGRLPRAPYGQRSGNRGSYGMRTGGTIPARNASMTRFSGGMSNNFIRRNGGLQ
jgi:hypothetical protein